MLKSRGPGPNSLSWKSMVVRHGKITSQDSPTDPECAPESAKSVSTSRTGSHRRGSYYLFLGFIGIYTDMVYSKELECDVTTTAMAKAILRLKTLVFIPS